MKQKRRKLIKTQQTKSTSQQKLEKFVKESKENNRTEQKWDIFNVLHWKLPKGFHFALDYFFLLLVKHIWFFSTGIEFEIIKPKHWLDVDIICSHVQSN